MEWFDDMIATIRSDVSILYKIWNETGLNVTSINERENNIRSYYLQLTKNMIEEETARKNRLIESIESIRRDINEIENEASIPSFNFPDKTCLLDLEDLLSKRRDELLKMTESRRNIFNNLIKVEKELCTILGEPQDSFEFKFTPSENIIQNLDEKINKLRMERKKREDNLIILKNSIQDHLNYLMLDSKNDLDALLFSYQESFPDLSIDFITSVCERLRYLEKEYKKLCDECFEKYQMHEKLSKRLGEPSLGYPENHIWSKDDLTLIEKSYEDLVVLKKQKIPEYVSQCRQDLINIIENCFIDPLSLKNIHNLLYSEPCEEILDELDSKMEYWKEFHDSNLEFFDSLQNYIVFKTKLEENMKKMKDPNVLKNRGGILLKIEKEIKQLKFKDLPKVEGIIINYDFQSKSNYYEWSLVHVNNLSIEKFIDSIKTPEYKENISKSIKRPKNDNDFSKSMIVLSPKNPRINTSTYSLFSPSTSALSSRGQYSPSHQN